GGVTGTAIVIFFAAHVAFGAAVAAAAVGAVLAVAVPPVPPPPPPHAVISIAKPRPMAQNARARICELPPIALSSATVRYHPPTTAPAPSSRCPSSRPPPPPPHAVISIAKPRPMAQNARARICELPLIALSSATVRYDPPTTGPDPSSRCPWSRRRSLARTFDRSGKRSRTR